MPSPFLWEVVLSVGGRLELRVTDTRTGVWESEPLPARGQSALLRALVELGPEYPGTVRSFLLVGLARACGGSWELIEACGQHRRPAVFYGPHVRDAEALELAPAIGRAS